MAFGLPPSYQERIKHGLSKVNCEKIVSRLVSELPYYELGHEDNAFDYRTKNGIMTMGERILIYVGETEMLVISKSLNPGQFIDFGRNKRNVQTFISAFYELKSKMK